MIKLEFSICGSSDCWFEIGFKLKWLYNWALDRVVCLVVFGFQIFKSIMNIMIDCYTGWVCVCIGFDLTKIFVFHFHPYRKSGEILFVFIHIGNDWCPVVLDPSNWPIDFAKTALQIGIQRYTEKSIAKQRRRQCKYKYTKWILRWYIWNWWRYWHGNNNTSIKCITQWG